MKNWVISCIITLLVLGGANVSIGPISSTMTPDIDASTEKKMDIEPLQTGGNGREYDIGDIIWQYDIEVGYHEGPDAIAPISDINGDGKSDVIICSGDDFVRCFNGGAIGTGSILWQHEIYAGTVYDQKGLAIIGDINTDGYSDIVVGCAWGARLIRAISGKNGTELWTHDTHEYGDGGWINQVDCRYDYNGDGIIDVLAATSDDSTDTGPQRVYCLNGVTGVSIWEKFLNGAVLSVIGINDCTGDDHPDVVAGVDDDELTNGLVYGLNGTNGNILWTFPSPGSSAWALEQIDDITGDGINDVIVGDYSGYIRGLNSINGNVIYSNKMASSSVIILRFAKVDDVNGDGHPDIVPAILGSGSTVGVKMINGQTGQFIWSHPVVDQPAVVDRIADISGDGINDLVVGTLYNSNYCYFLNGINGSELALINYSEAVDAIAAVPDVVGDGSMEMVAGGREGLVICFSGGLNASSSNSPPDIPTVSGPTSGVPGESATFIFVTTDPNSDSIYYQFDWGDGTPYVWYGPVSSGTPFAFSHTWSEGGIYPVKAKAKDTYGAESGWSSPWFITISAQVNISLYTGWNLITIPIQHTCTAETLGSNITGCSVVLMFNASNQFFLTHVVGTPWDDFPILDGVGYFLYVTSDSIYTLWDVPITSVTVPISPGWNILGWYHDYPTTAESLGDSIPGSSVVLMFDAQTQTFVTHVVGTPWDNFTIERGMGLFIYTTESSVWHGEG